MGAFCALFTVAVAAAVPTKTIENLKNAFAGETTAFSKYTQYAAAAEKEARPYEASLFRAAARAEGYHARNHKQVLDTLGARVSPSKYVGRVGTTLQNLRDAVKGERYENKTMYPNFLADAKAEGVDAAVRSFSYARNAEETHQALYASAIANIDNKTKSPAMVFFVCPRCGETFASVAPGSCPICATDKSLFVRIK